MYFVFCKVYPKLKKPLFYAFFLIPSVVLWGSGVLKDTVTIAGIGWIVYAFMNLIILKRKKVLSIILILFFTVLIADLKPYILYILYPSLFIWVQSNLKELIKANVVRKLVSPFVAIVLISSAVFISQKMAESSSQYNLNEIEDTLEGFQSWHTTLSETDDQSGYTLGNGDNTPLGMLKQFPAAVNVTFYRPYLWEIRNASTLLGAIEGLTLLVVTMSLVLKYRQRLFRIIYKNKDILFLLIFAIVFGAVVGLSSYNFGALSRYKMPAQMFFVIALVLINNKIELDKKIS